jgi:hypothetical protein
MQSRLNWQAQKTKLPQFHCLPGRLFHRSGFILSRGFKFGYGQKNSLCVNRGRVLGFSEEGQRSNPTRGVAWLRIGCGSCVFLPRYAALCRCKSCKLNGLNTWSKTGSQEVTDSIPVSSTNKMNDLHPSGIWFRYFPAMRSQYARFQCA